MEENNFVSFKDAINNLRLKEPIIKKLPERATLFKDLYYFYEISYKKNTWSNYLVWLKTNKYKHSKDRVEEYKKICYKKISVKSFCSYWLGFIPTKDLYYLLSIAKDMDNRNQNFNKWLFYSIKVQNTTT